MNCKGATELPTKIKKSKESTAKVRPRWTKEEVALLKRLYRTHSNAEIASLLGRKVSSVVFKVIAWDCPKAPQVEGNRAQNIRKRWIPEKEAAKKTETTRSRK